MPADRGRDPQRRVALPRRVDDVGGRLPSDAAAGHAAPQPAARGDLSADPRRGRSALADRDGQIAAASDAWYRGFVAEAMHRVPAARVDGQLGRASCRPARGGRPSRLARRRTSCRSTVDYHGVDRLKAGPWSQAPVFLQQLRLLEGFDLAAHGHASAEYVHTITECAKLAFADREAWYGDPEFYDVPMETLLSRDVRGRAAHPRRRDVVGRVAPGLPRRPRAPARRRRPAGAPLAPGVGEPTRGDTVHLDVVDRWGNMVAATPSGGWLWGAPVIPELGFCLGTRAQMFWLEEGLPNSLEPGKRPRTTLSPTLVGRDGEPYLALGTPGGDQQDQWTLHVLLGHLHFGLDLQAAIDAPVPSHGGVPELVLSARDATASRRGRGPRRRGDVGRPAQPRPRRRGVRAVVARPRERGRPRARRAAEGRREPARHAGLRRRPLRI